ncbi:MAG: hypothetical protein ABIR18_00785 [Chitinophagaceae bacterium]
MCLDRKKYAVKLVYYNTPTKIIRPDVWSILSFAFHFLFMIFPGAVSADIPPIQVVRNLVLENPLPDPKLVTDEDCEDPKQDGQKPEFAKTGK